MAIAKILCWVAATMMTQLKVKRKECRRCKPSCLPGRLNRPNSSTFTLCTHPNLIWSHNVMLVLQRAASQV